MFSAFSGSEKSSQPIPLKKLVTISSELYAEKVNTLFNEILQSDITQQQKDVFVYVITLSTVCSSNDFYLVLDRYFSNEDRKHNAFVKTLQNVNQIANQVEPKEFYSFKVLYKELISTPGSFYEQKKNILNIYSRSMKKSIMENLKKNYSGVLEENSDAISAFEASAHRHPFGM